MPKKEQEIQPIDASMDDIVEGMVTHPLCTSNISNKNKYIDVFSNSVGTIPIQGDLFHVDKQIELDGIEMGVLENGMPYLTSRGLARMCGIDHAPFHRLTTNWEVERIKPRGKAINDLLKSANYNENNLFFRAEHNGRPINAFPEPVCLALLEYYAFVADEKREQAQNAFRVLARTKFREFVYDAVGYSPEIKVLDSWKHFHDRTDITMDAAPFGYFGVFREIAIMIVPMIRAGIMISDRVVPDIPVGKAWSLYWEENRLSENFGDRMKYDHEYPDYYPQSKSSPQPSFCYPNGSLGAFREWLQQYYISTKFPKYLLGQTSKGSIAHDVASKAIQAFGGDALPAPKAKRIK